MWKWIFISIGTVAVLLALVAVVGLFVPREHSATCRARFRANAETLFTILSDIEGFPSWRPDVRSVKRVNPIGDKPAYVEVTKQGRVTYAIEASEPPARRVLRIADEGLPYGGTWTFRLSPEGDGCVVSITEDGFVKPAIFRALAHFVFGYHSTMEAFLKALGNNVGETANVERVL